MMRPVHFEYPADDPERAAEFYRKVFGWEVAKWEGEVPYWIVKTGEDTEMGINGGISPRMAGTESLGQRNVIAVGDLGAVVAKAEEAGGTRVTPNVEVPGIGTLAYVKDTEGNLIGILQPSPEMMPPG
jgi:predicted enzyme related to lactoylglutathione lyase